MSKKLKLFRIDPDLEAGLKRLTAVEHETESTIIRRALREYLQKTGAVRVERIDARTGRIVRITHGKGGRVTKR